MPLNRINFTAGAFTAGSSYCCHRPVDYPNQVNNILGFPGIFRGALDAGATCINEEMKIAAAYAIASIIDENELSRDYIIPSPFDRRVVQRVAKAVAEAAEKTRVTGNTEKDSKGL